MLSKNGVLLIGPPKKKGALSPLMFFFTALLTAECPFHAPLSPSFSLSLGQIRAGCCLLCQDQSVWIQSPGGKIRTASFSMWGGDRMHAYYLTVGKVNKALCFV